VTVLLLASAAAVAGAMACRDLYKRVARARAEARELKTTAIKDAPSGRVVTMKGRALGHHESATAPLSGRQCLAWTVSVEELVATPRTNEWTVILEDSDGVDFRLEDGSGRALVRLEEARLELTEDEHLDTDSYDDRFAMGPFLDARDQRLTGVLGLPRRLRLHEAVLSSGDEVVVRGAGVWEMDPDPAPVSVRGTYRTAARRLVLGSSAEGELVVTADPGPRVATKDNSY
jgi:hypothetical protein